MILSCILVTSDSSLWGYIGPAFGRKGKSLHRIGKQEVLSIYIILSFNCLTNESALKRLVLFRVGQQMTYKISYHEYKEERLKICIWEYYCQEFL